MTETTLNTVYTLTPIELAEAFKEERGRFEEFEHIPPTPEPEAAPSLPSSLLLAALEALIDARVAVAIGNLPKTPAIFSEEQQDFIKAAIADAYTAVKQDIELHVATEIETAFNDHSSEFDHDRMEERIKDLEDANEDGLEEAVRDALDGAEISVTIKSSRSRY